MEENQGQGKKKILSVCCWGLAAFISVAFFFTMDLWRSEASDEAETLKDKVDGPVLPESKGENHLAGKIFSSPERTIRYVFQSETSMLLEHVFSMDAKFKMPFSILCDYSLDSTGGKLFIKPVSLVTENSSTSSSSEISSILNESLFSEILSRYPKFETEENFSDLKILSLERAKKIVCGNLFEIFSFDYTLLPSALLIEEIFPENYLLRREGLKFVSDDDSKVFRISPDSFYFVYDDTVSSFSYGAVPDFEDESPGVKFSCSLKFFDSDLALGEVRISDAGTLEGKIYADEKSRTVQSVDVYMEIISAPESFCLSAGERFRTRLPSAELLEWMRLEDTEIVSTESEEGK